MRSIPQSVLRLLLPAALGAAPFAAGITPADLSARLSRNENVLVVDVRPAIAYGEGHIPGAINIPAALLPYKRLPSAAMVVVCGDGLGMTEDAPAVAAVRVPANVPVEALAGGYAAWLSDTHVSTAWAGVVRESIPGITYDRLVAADKRDIVLVDLRKPATTAAAHAQVDAPTANAAAANVVAEFAGRLGVPVVAAQPQPVSAGRHALSAPVGPATAPVASALESAEQRGKLLVLVADTEADANQAARQLRARGHFRFTLLIGGTEAIRREGRIGSGRMTGGVYAGQPER